MSFDQKSLEERLNVVRELLTDGRFPQAVPAILLNTEILAGQSGISLPPDFYRLMRRAQHAVHMKASRTPKHLWQDWAYSMTGSKSKAMVAALEDFDKGREYPDFGEFLRPFVKKKEPHINVQRYGLELDTHVCTNSGNNNGFGNVYCEAVFNFCLTYDFRLIAWAGFEPRDKCVFIKQIQGTKGAGEPLGAVNFSAALVSWAVEWASQNKVPSVGVRSVDNIGYAKETYELIKSNSFYPAWVQSFDDAKGLNPEQEQNIREKIRAAYPQRPLQPGLTPRQGFLRYDKTARRLGFERMADRNYLLRLSA